MPEVLSLAEAVRLRLVMYQLLELSVPVGSSVALGATVSSQNDFEDETARPELSMACMSTLCLPSGRPSTPEAGKVIQLLLSRLYSKADNPEPGAGSEAEAFNVAAVYHVFEPS